MHGGLEYTGAISPHSKGEVIFRVSAAAEWRVVARAVVVAVVVNVSVRTLLLILLMAGELLSHSQNFKTVSTSTPRNRISISTRDFAG